MKPTVPELNPSVPSSVRTAPTAPAIVISSPSSTQATPRAITMRVWNGAHGSRSMRAGMTLRITPSPEPPRPTAALLVIERLLVACSRERHDNVARHLVQHSRVVICGTLFPLFRRVMFLHQEINEIQKRLIWVVPLRRAVLTSCLHGTARGEVAGGGAETAAPMRRGVGGGGGAGAPP